MSVGGLALTSSDNPGQVTVVAVIVAAVVLGLLYFLLWRKRR